MKTITLNCEVITPMFLAGADGRTPELRPSSIKGMLRFWWRAMQGFDKITELHQKEGEIFGGTDEGMGRSKFSLRIKKNDPPPKFKYYALPHKEMVRLPAIKPGYAFKMITDADEQIQNLIEIASFLGGLGKRSRRGFGAFQIKNNDFELGALADQLNKIGGEKLFELSNNKIERKNCPGQEYPYIKRIQLGEDFSRYDDLLKTIGKISHSNNSKHTGWAVNMRLSSPLIVSVIRQQNNYVPVITTLETVHPNKQSFGSDTQQKFISELINYG